MKQLSIYELPSYVQQESDQPRENLHIESSAADNVSVINNDDVLNDHVLNDNVFNDHALNDNAEIHALADTVASLPIKAELENEDSEVTNTDAHTANVTEIIIARNKQDHIQMLLPMLNNLNQEKRWLAWIDPPIQLLKQWQETYSALAMEEIMILRSSDSNSAVELSQKALEAGTCHAVIAWAPALSNQEFELLEQASAKGNSHGIFLRAR